MEWEEYQEEIELIEKQNNVEHDLYNVIYSVLRGSNSLKKLSIRNVCDRRRTKEQIEKVFWGIKGFPDFVLLDKKVSDIQWSEIPIYGAVEVKYVGKPMLVEKADITQLIGHVLWFNNVIYTNGIEWRVYSNTWKGIESEDIVKFQNDTYSMINKGDWDKVDDKLMNEDYSLEKLEPKIFSLRDSEKRWDKKSWDDLVEYLNNMNITPINRS